MKIVYKGVDISTEDKFLGFVDSINQQTQKQVINKDCYQIKEPLDMEVSIRVNEVKNKDNIKGFATVVFGDAFKITNIAILENKETGNLFVSMPR